MLSSTGFPTLSNTSSCVLSRSNTLSKIKEISSPRPSLLIMSWVLLLMRCKRRGLGSFYFSLLLNGRKRQNTFMLPVSSFFSIRCQISIYISLVDHHTIKSEFFSQSFWPFIELLHPDPLAPNVQHHWLFSVPDCLQSCWNRQLFR